MQAKSPTEGTAALYHLLRLGDGASQLRNSEVGKEIVVKDQGAWLPASFIMISMYHKELKYLTNQRPFKCKHGIEVTSLGAEYNGR